MSGTEPIQTADGWPVVSPGSAHVDAVALADLTRSVEQGEYPNTHAILIEHAGSLIYEAYFAGQDVSWPGNSRHVVFDAHTLHDLRSVTKSVTALLLGLALGDDHAEALATPISEFFQDVDFNFGKGVDEATLFQALTMTAGFDWNELTEPWGVQNDEYILHEASSPVKMLLSRPVAHSPGKKWTYNSGLTELLGVIIAQTSGQRLDDFANEKLFKPLGITHFEWHRARNWEPAETPIASGGLRLRARDAGKIGSLLLHNGVWGGKQIVPGEWIDKSTQQHVSMTNQLSAAHYGYGFHWYIGQSTSIPSYLTITAAGNGGQRLMIFPEQHLVLTVLAGNYDGSYQDSAERMQGRIISAHIQHD